MTTLGESVRISRNSCTARAHPMNRKTRRARQAGQVQGGTQGQRRTQTGTRLCATTFCEIQLRCLCKARRDRPGSPESPNKPHRRGSFSDDESDRGEDTRDSRTTNRKIVIEDLQKIRLSRRQIMNCHGKPWFKDYLAGTRRRLALVQAITDLGLKGAYVRYLIEGTGVNNTYRVCRINSE